jgi:exosortase E/protease (VPEID-CTERM system)
VLFAAFAYLRYRAALEAALGEAMRTPVAWKFLASHALAMVLFFILSASVYGKARSANDLLSACWLVSVLAAILCGCFSVLSPKLWIAVVRATEWLWACVAGAALAAGSAETLFRSLWSPASRVTLVLARIVARVFVRDIVVDAPAYTISTKRFAVIVNSQCSGLEGIGLFLVFGVIWMVLFRDEVRLPQALVLFPAGVIALMGLNGVRIAGLLLIGHLGAEEVAKNGFHSQAGWLAFNAVAFGIVVVARRVPWISTRPVVREESKAPAIPDATAAYLMPFLCVLAAGMISRAGSGTFEWWYPLRLAAAAGALWCFRERYAKILWRPNWVAAATGIAVFLFWVGLDRFSGVLRSPMPAALLAAPFGIRWAWIAVRILSAVITVPLAEELAFRGYLMRRLVAPDFESVAFRRFTWFSLLASSLLFGMMHGSRWIAGTVAGVAYVWIVLRRGRLGDAVAAHALTNLLLAGYVLTTGQWQFW